MPLLMIFYLLIVTEILINNFIKLNESFIESFFKNKKGKVRK